MKKTFLLVAFAMSACAEPHPVIDTVGDMVPNGAEDAGAPAEPPPVIDWTLPSVITLFIEDHPDLDEELIVKGCERWKATEGFDTGIERCERASSEKTASIRVYARAPICDVDAGEEAVGWAFQSGANIEMRIGCLHHYFDYGPSPQKIEPRALNEVAAHEVGHLLGIWQHVPLESGSAVMNPAVDLYLTELTDLDREAFRNRDIHASIHR